jgi:hypothetical protein
MWKANLIKTIGIAHCCLPVADNGCILQWLEVLTAYEAASYAVLG